MRLITAEEVIAMGPCPEYTEEIIRKNHGPDGITVRAISELDIPIEDRRWVLYYLAPDSIKRGIITSNMTANVTALVNYLEQHDDAEVEQ